MKRFLTFSLCVVLLMSGLTYGYDKGPIVFPAKPRTGMYTPSTTQEYELGTRCVTVDGRVFRYAKLGGAITNARVDYGLYFASGPRNKWYEHPSQGQSTGDMSITLPFDEANSVLTDGNTVAKDELAGGYIVIYKDGVANQCVRQITSNTASTEPNAYSVTVYLDAALPYDVVVADGVELIRNPWGDVRSMFADNKTATTMCGMPTVVAASGTYTWVQTWGICRVSLTEPGVLERSVYCASNGSMCNRGDIGSGGNMDQIIGVVILPGIYHSAFIMLQISP